jgi:hypothetical protein
MRAHGLQIMSIVTVAAGLVLSGLAIQPAEAQVLENQILVRPENGVSDPSLEEAWVIYGTTVAKAEVDVRKAITRQIEAVRKKGDLQAVEKWKSLEKSFESERTLPPPEAGGVLREATEDFTRANQVLMKAYANLTKSMTKEGRDKEARAVEDERARLEGMVFPSKRYLSDLPAFDVHSPATFESFIKGLPLNVGAQARNHCIHLHPPSNGESKASFDVPEAYASLRGEVVIMDLQPGEEQSTPCTFRILGGKKKIWVSKPIHVKGPVRKQEFCVPLDGVKTITLVVECPGDFKCARAVWIDPRFDIAQ